MLCCMLHERIVLVTSRIFDGVEVLFASEEDGPPTFTYVVSRGAWFAFCDGLSDSISVWFAAWSLF